MTEAGNDRSDSAIQKSWQAIAGRLRMVVDRALVQAEEHPETATPEQVHDLATAALSTFALERQAASMDAAIRRESRDW
jgi:nitrogen-specific signal transduction histidine kinase